MSDPKWQEHFLSDIVETQLLLFFHLARALDEAGILPREVSATILRKGTEQAELRPGVRSCLRAVAEQLERTDVRPAAPAWEPRVVPGGARETDEGAGREASAAKRGTGKARSGHGRSGNGQAANGSLPAGWRPSFVGDRDPDSDPDCA